MAPAPPTSSSSLLHKVRISQYISLSPASLSRPFPAICATVFSPLLLSYFSPARGIVLAWEDGEISEKPPAKETVVRVGGGEEEDEGRGEMVMLTHVDEYTAPYIWATATFLVFRPARNATISGSISHQARTHITLSYLNTFPITILASHLPETWSYNAGETTTSSILKSKSGLSREGGFWLNELGEKIDGTVEGVRILDFDGRVDGGGKGRGKGMVRIEGSLLSREEEGRRKAGEKDGRKGKTRA